MKTQLIKIAVMTILLLGFFMAKAQPGKRDNIRQLKIAFFTEKLTLTPEEAQVFWPVYNAYSKELEALRFKRRQNIQTLRQFREDMSDKELEEMADSFIASQQKEVEISARYYERFKKVLPIRKVILLIQAEEQFKQKLIKILQEKREERMKNRDW